LKVFWRIQEHESKMSSQKLNYCLILLNCIRTLFNHGNKK